MTKFLHTADWQLGKPFAGVEDVQKRSALQKERIDVIARIGVVAKEEGAEFILVAGDLFDSPSASQSTVAAACSAIGQLEIPVIAIPGNHDHGGPGSLWGQDFFQRESAALAPNLRILLKPEPVELDGATLFPCPLMRRAESRDTTAWLRSGEIFAQARSGKPRIVLAHGSTRTFQGNRDGTDGLSGNEIDCERLPVAEYDYLALGDWHGAKQVSGKAWYSGTPELDRFPKGEGNRPGYVLLVEVERGAMPVVVQKRTARLRWNEFAFNFSDDASFAIFRDQLGALMGQRAHEDLLQLRITGSLGIEASARLGQHLESLNARLLRLKLSDETVIAPTTDEIEALTERHTNPLIASVARKLIQLSTSADDEAAAIAQIALRELHAEVGRG